MIANRVEVERIDDVFLAIGFALVSDTGQILGCERVLASVASLDAYREPVLQFFERIRANDNSESGNHVFPRLQWGPSLGVVNTIHMSTGKVSEVCFGAFSVTAYSNLAHKGANEGPVEREMQGVLRVECQIPLLKELISKLYVG